MIKTIIIFMLAIMVTGCGFKLQGQNALPFNMKHLIVVTGNNNDIFQVQLKDVLQNNGVTLVNKNASMLDIDTPIVTVQINSYDSKGQISQYRVIAASSYKLFDNHSRLVRQNQIVRSRTYSLNTNQLLSNSSEQKIIAEELNIEIINELLRQLSSGFNNINIHKDNKDNQNDINCPC